jgi:hypothetical protein
MRANRQSPVVLIHPDWHEAVVALDSWVDGVLDAAMIDAQAS